MKNAKKIEDMDIDELFLHRRKCSTLELSFMLVACFDALMMIVARHIMTGAVQTITMIALGFGLAVFVTLEIYYRQRKEDCMEEMHRKNRTRTPGK